MQIFIEINLTLYYDNSSMRDFQGVHVALINITDLQLFTSPTCHKTNATMGIVWSKLKASAH